MEEATAGGGVGLTDDLVVDILSCLPVDSICRFKLVSPSWRNLISHPDNRKKLPQTVAGFFSFDEFDSCTFVSLVEPPPPGGGGQEAEGGCDFLPANTGGRVVDCCNGLVLLEKNNSGPEPHASYVVCNPAIKKWTAVPGSTLTGKICSASILCFDPAVSLHFHIVQLLEWEEDDEDDFWITGSFYGGRLFGFNIYSSATGAWVFHPHNSHTSPVAHRSRRTFFNGLLHFVADDDGVVTALDMEGQTRRVIPLPRSGEVQLIGHSQGRLLYANRDAHNSPKLSIHVLGENGRWNLMHCVDTSLLTSLLFADADEHLQSGLLVGVAAIHPHGDSIFLFDSLQGRLMSYGMGSRRDQVIHSAKESPKWSKSPFWSKIPLWSFVPYVPLYLETAALGNSN